MRAISAAASASSPSLSDLLDLAAGSSRGTSRNPRHDLVEDLEQAKPLSLTQPADPFAEIENGVTHDGALGFCQSFGRLPETADRLGIQSEGHLGHCHTVTILPYQRGIDGGERPRDASADASWRAFV